jgi:ubiquinone/menaquinone biosynthesis C-methylase UbiE
MIRKWVIKALVQKTISILPFRQKLNYIFQKYVTGGIELTDLHWTDKLGCARDHISFYKNYNSKGLQGTTVLELGTGWYPIVPVCLYLSNADKIISIDIQSWMTKPFQLKALEKFIESRNKGELEGYLSEINEDRWHILEDILKNQKDLTKEDINKMINLETIIKDARNTALPDNSIDFISSNNTFEHIPKEILFQILKEFQRIIKVDGLMSHYIDMSDHFSHYDTSITNYNFLRFSKSVWNLIDNSIQPQNRLRFIDYKRMYEQLQIPVTKEIITDSKINQLKQVKTSKEFTNYTEDELVISHGYIISKMNGK